MYTNCWSGGLKFETIRATRTTIGTTIRNLELFVSSSLPLTILERYTEGSFLLWPYFMRASTSTLFADASLF